MKLSVWCIVGIKSCGTRGYLRKEGEKSGVPRINWRAPH